MKEVVDSNNDPSSLLQQSYPLEGKSSTGSNQEDSGTTGSQAKKRRVGRPRKHAKLIEDDKLAAAKAAKKGKGGDKPKKDDKKPAEAKKAPAAAPKAPDAAAKATVAAP